MPIIIAVVSSIIVLVSQNIILQCFFWYNKKNQLITKLLKINKKK